MKKSKTKYVIVLLIVFLISLTVGYAAFSDTLTISGTANAKGTFDMQFISAQITKQIGVNNTANLKKQRSNKIAKITNRKNRNNNNNKSPNKVDSSIDIPGTEISITPDKNSVNVSIKDLAYPGAGVEFKTVIKNCGTVPAKLKAVKTVGTNDPDIKVIFPNFKIGEQIQANKTYDVVFQVIWDKNSKFDATQGSKKLDFSLQLDYEQDTEIFLNKASYFIK